jgi:uncharacterized RDD family membrane protein YckC
MYCSKCGTAIPQGEAFCSACGQPVNPPFAAGPNASISAASVPPSLARPYVSVSPAPLFPQSAYAGFWLRVVAAIIDGIVISIPLVPMCLILFASMIPALTRGEDPMNVVMTVLPRIALFLLAALILSWLYWAGLESSAWQATLGKKALGLYVTEIAGNRATFARASGRFFAGRGIGHVPSFGGLYFLISCICAGLTEKKQALHDMIASCLVLRRV